jgi:hypothetical protein
MQMWPSASTVSAASECGDADAEGETDDGASEASHHT